MVSRAFILLLLLLAAMFAAWKWWPAEYLPVIIFPGKEEPQPELTVQTIPQTREDIAYAEGDAAPVGNTLASPATDVQAQQKALDGIAAHIAGKGAQILDKKLFANIESCTAAMANVTAEYGRRGIQASEIVDASAFLEVAGARMTTINNMDGYFYLLCVPHPQNLWAGYIQFKLTDEQIRLLNQGGAVN